jgi:hypothetical protein
MTTVNQGLKVKLQSTEELAKHNFLGLCDGEVDVISQQAVTEMLVQKQKMGLPITTWNNGNPYEKYPDGRIEYIQP